MLFIAIVADACLGCPGVYFQALWVGVLHAACYLTADVSNQISCWNARRVPFVDSF